MLDFIPAQYYAEIYLNLVLILVVFILIHTFTLTGSEKRVFNLNIVLSSLLLITLIILFGFRPIHRVFVDMGSYANAIELYKKDMPLITTGDVGFEVYMYLMAKIGSLDFFFLVSTILYIVPLFLACKIWFPRYYLFAFVLFVGSFSFFTYGVNGMRNGIATSLFVLAIALHKKRFWMILILIISISVHQSLKLPVLAFILTYFYNDSKKYFIFWLLSIILAIALGPSLINMFTVLGIGGEKASGYLSNQASLDNFNKSGFRYDFLLYGAIPIFAGYYYKFKKNYSDKFYDRILNTYLICNSMWVMINTASFSNRFAYLSWFLMAIVICYPYLKVVFWKKQFHKIGIITLLYFGFTYFMSYIYYG